MAQLSESIRTAAMIALPLVFAVTLHEAAHGWMANRKGDSTARLLGRITANPLPHIDPVGTVLVPLLLLLSGAGFLFGWAKPVPVNFRALRRPRIDMAWVAAAGPGANLLMALAAGVACQAVVWMLPELGLVLRWPPFSMPGEIPEGYRLSLPLLLIFKCAVELNVILMCFNLLPIPPLDGGRVAVGLLPPGPAHTLSLIEPVGIFVVLALVWLDPGGAMHQVFWPGVLGLARLILGG
ncbi:MAG: site-2 protease family protein [Nitrospirota bacterium]|nr:site-2 protease family protein [Nitrospirota bacterium]